VRRDRLAGPEWAHLLGRVVAHCEDEIEMGRFNGCELIPRLAPSVGRAQPRSLDLPNGLRTHCARRVATRAMGCEVRAAFEVHDRFSHDRTSRIPVPRNIAL
jgi:hypothetical protein